MIKLLNMDQHFLPACYLEQFCSTEGEFYKLDCSLLKRGKKPYPLKVTPAAICYGKDFMHLLMTLKKSTLLLSTTTETSLKKNFTTMNGNTQLL